MGCAQEMRALACQLTGDPAALAPSGRDLAVERCRKLQGEERPMRFEAEEKSGIEFGRLFGTKTDVDGDPRIAQLLNAATRDPRIRIGDRHDDARNTRGDQRIAARRCLAVMTARLEADISGSALCE